VVEQGSLQNPCVVLLGPVSIDAKVGALFSRRYGVSALIASGRGTVTLSHMSSMRARRAYAVTSVQERERDQCGSLKARRVGRYAVRVTCVAAAHLY
jgi:enoyl-[acyl-carrier-protein] reductase (NADH)